LAHRQLLFGFCGHKVKRRVENLPTIEAGAADKKVAVIMISLRVTGRTLASAQEPERTDGDISRRMPEAALGCLIPPCRD
jgi:hypothetical protein